MNKTIMIVEDDQSFHDLYTEMLEETDYEITHAYDGDDALSKLEEKKPDLIILDMLLDMVTGDILLLYLKGMPEYARIPVIIISASSAKHYKNLKKTDPNLVYVNKSHLTTGRLLGEIGENLSRSSC